MTYLNELKIELDQIELTATELKEKLHSYAEETKWNPAAIKHAKQLMDAVREISSLHRTKQLEYATLYISRFPQKATV